MEIGSFGDFDKLVAQARASFAAHAQAARTRFVEASDLFFEFFAIVADAFPEATWAGGREEGLSKILSKAFSKTLAAWYLSESGFYEDARQIMRNVVELHGILMCVGRSDANYARWKEGSKPFHGSGNFLAILKCAESIPGLEDAERDFLRFLKSQWLKLSDEVSHETKREAVEPYARSRQLRFRIDVVKEVFQEKRINALTSSVLSLLRGAFFAYRLEVVAQSRPELKVRIDIFVAKNLKLGEKMRQLETS